MIDDNEVILTTSLEDLERIYSALDEIVTEYENKFPVTVRTEIGALFVDFHHAIEQLRQVSLDGSN